MSEAELNTPIVTSIEALADLSQIFAILPKLSFEMGSYDFSLEPLKNNSGFILSFTDLTPEDAKKIVTFLDQGLDKETEGYVFGESEHGIHLKIDNVNVLMKLLTNYVEKGDHDLSADQLEKINKGINDVIRKEAGVHSNPYMDTEAGSWTCADLVCDVFNTLLKTAGLNDHDADYNLEEEDGRFEIMIDSDGENDPGFVKFCEEIAENAEDAGVGVSIHGNYDEMILNAENELAMITVLRGYFTGYRLMTAEMIARGGPEFDPKAAREGGLAYIQSMDEFQLCANHPMIHVTAGDNKSRCEIFYLKANETVSINLDAIEVTYYQEKSLYGEVQDRHRAFIVH